MKLERSTIPNFEINGEIGKTNFSAFMEINGSNFRLKLCKRAYSYKNCQTNQI